MRLIDTDGGEFCRELRHADAEARNMTIGISSDGAEHAYEVNGLLALTSAISAHWPGATYVLNINAESSVDCCPNYAVNAAVLAALEAYDWGNQGEGELYDIITETLYNHISERLWIRN